MKITSNSLQELINKKAQAKAKAEIDTLIKDLQKSGLFDIEKVYIKEGEKSRDLKYFLSDNSFKVKENILTMLYEKKVAEYIISETKLFVSKVESLVEQTDTLLNIAENY